jgi:hypothetical protein
MNIRATQGIVGVLAKRTVDVVRGSRCGQIGDASRLKCHHKHGNYLATGGEKMPEHSSNRVRLAKMGENRKTGEKGRFRVAAPERL